MYDKVCTKFKCNTRDGYSLFCQGHTHTCPETHKDACSLKRNFLCHYYYNYYNYTYTYLLTTQVL